MEYKELKKLIINLDLGKTKTIYQIDENTRIFLTKPLTVPAKLKQNEKYDPKNNFQIGLSKKNQKEFLPNHLRILIDLYLKNEHNQKDAEILFDMIEDIYEGKDPENYKEKAQKLNFRLEIEKPFTILCLAQLFMLEQDINYTFGKVQPPRSYLMGYIRMIRLKAEELDKLLWSSTRHPPRVPFRTKNYLNQSTLR